MDQHSRDSRIYWKKRNQECCSDEMPFMFASHYRTSPMSSDVQHMEENNSKENHAEKKNTSPQITEKTEANGIPGTSLKDHRISLVSMKRKKRTRFHAFTRQCRMHRGVRSILEEWIFLALLGISMAVLSLGMDFCIEVLRKFHVIASDYIDAMGTTVGNDVAVFAVWSCYTVLLITMAVAFAHFVAPQAIGSGIPEMKTILQGVVLKEYLSFRTLISKMVGLTLSIGSGLPIGKEGPFVHVGSIVASGISHWARTFRPIYANESRSIEMLAAGCAVGVACTFSAPVGGVLFSIEVVSVYFAVRDYWRGFFAAAWSSCLFSLFRTYTGSSITVEAFYQTTFKQMSFVPEELGIFLFLGIICGACAALFIYLHRQLVYFIRRNKVMKKLFQRNRFIYPILISALCSLVLCEKGVGRFISPEPVYAHTVKYFFDSCSWTVPLDNSSNACSPDIIKKWMGGNGDISVFAQLSFFCTGYFIISLLCSTLPVPAGIFLPSFVLGAGFGRLIGEFVAHQYPQGFHNGFNIFIHPGIYSIAGAGAFCGGVTHTISVIVIAFELTGQLVFLLPVMVAVIAANVTCAIFQPSFFDSIIKIKHLPYLPDIPKSISIAHSVRVNQIMQREVNAISKETTYGELHELLMQKHNLKAFPVVESPSSMILLGSVSRENLVHLLEKQIGREARNMEIFRHKHAGGGYSNKESPSPHGVASPEKRVPKRRLRARSKTEIILTEFDRNRLRKIVTKSQEKRSKERHSPDGEERRKASFYQHFKLQSPHHKTAEVYQTIGNVLRNISHGLLKAEKSSKSDIEEIEFLKSWEKRQLAKKLNISQAIIDPAPFQLVEDTSLYKVHSLFSLLGIRKAYVTHLGALIGVVNTEEIRIAIEKIQSGAMDEKIRKMSMQPKTVVYQFTEDGTAKLAEVETVETDESEQSDDTDNEDYVTPRIDVVESTPHVALINTKLPMTRSYTANTDRLDVITESVTVPELTDQCSSSDTESSAPLRFVIDSCSGTLPGQINAPTVIEVRDPDDQIASPSTFVPKSPQGSGRLVTTTDSENESERL